MMRKNRLYSNFLIMQNNEEQIIGQVREYIFNTAPLRLDMSLVAEAVQINLDEIIMALPSPEILITKMLHYEKESFKKALSQYDFADQSAIDNLIVVGQVVYNRYQNVHPCVFTRLQGYSPAFPQERYIEMIQQIFDFFISTINSGMCQGIFNPEVTLKQPNTNFIKKIISQENEMISKTQRFITFGVLFNNYFEEFLQGNLSNEAWQYFITRKRFVESLDFGR